MGSIIDYFRILFFVITCVALVVAIVACLTDVQPTTRLFWIGVAITCLGVVTSWKTSESAFRQEQEGIQ